MYSFNKLTLKVDICITTPYKVLEETCLLAAALAERLSSFRLA